MAMGDKKATSGLPVARRAPAGRTSLLAPIQLPAGFTTSTPARGPGLLSAMPAPLPTPQDRLPAMLQEEADSTFFQAVGANGGGDEAEETALLGLKYDGHAAFDAQDTFIGGQDQAAEVAETTIMLQQRAFATNNNNTNGSGLGGKLFEMLMSQSQSTQIVPAASRAPQDVLLSIDLGNSQLGREKRLSTSPKKPRTSAARRNERSSIGPSGQSFVDFDTDVRFGDDLLGGGSKEASPEAETINAITEPLPEVQSFGLQGSSKAPALSFFSRSQGSARQNLFRSSSRGMFRNQAPDGLL